MKIGDLVEICEIRDRFSPMTQRFGGTIGVIIDIIKVTTFADSAPSEKFVVLLQDKQREYWFDEVELKVIN
jgi:hypothetical protein